MKHRLAKCVYALLLLAFSLPGSAQQKGTDPLPFDPNVKRGKLSNGLTYYIRKNSRPEKKVELRLVVNAGSVLENEDQRGLAHFMEHMSFNGSKNFPKNELVNYLQATGVKFGADLNAYTSFDETVYILPIPSDKPETVEKGFTVLEDWAFNNLFDKEEIEKERGVVLEESRLSKGANQRMMRQYFPRLFEGSLYANRLPIGNDTILSTFKHSTLQSFYKQWYRPDLMAVVVVGDIDPAVAEQKIKAHFSKFTNPPKAPARPAIIPIQPRTKPEALVVTDEEATNSVLQIFNFIKPVKKVTTWKDYRDELLEELVTSLINQRLAEITQQEKPPFLYGFAGMSPFLRGYKAFTSIAVLGNNPAPQAVDALVAETEKARQHGFLASELERAKSDLLNATENAYKERDKSESGQLVGEYVSHFLEGAPALGIENRYKYLKEALPKVTLQEVNDVVRAMPSTENAFALITGPAKMKAQLPDNDALLKVVTAAANRPVAAYTEKAVASRLMDKAPEPGKVTAEKTNTRLNTTDLTLGNGVTVTLKPTTFKNDQISMDAWRLGGYQRFDLADKENAQYAAVIVQQMGVQNFSPTDLQKFLSGKTASVSPYINPADEGIEGTTSVKDFETFLQLIHLYLTQPRKDEALFRSFVSKQKSSVQFLRQNPRMFYQDTLSRIVYGNNPWRNSLPAEEDFNKLDLERSLAAYNQVFGNANGLHFTFVGNIDPKTARPLLEKYLGSLPSAPYTPATKDVGLRPVRGKVEADIRKGKEAQSMISLQFHGETEYGYREDLVLKALVEVLNIRVTEKLREEMGGIYGGGFSGGISRHPYTRYSVSAMIPCGPENVDKLTAALIGLVKEVQQKGVEEKDLNKVKEAWKKQHDVNLKDNGFWLNTLAYAHLQKDDPELVLTYLKEVESLKPADLQKAAKKYFDWNNYIKAVLYPETAAAGNETKKAF